jgi:hypothetical protein
MRLLIPVWVLVAALHAQTAQQPPDKQEFTRMIDALRAAIRADDWAEASRISIRLNAALLERRTRAQPTPMLELQHLEMLGGNNPITRNPLLPRMAKAAYAASEWKRAEDYASAALEAAKAGVFSWTGDAIHQGNIVLGRLALRRQDVEAAKRYLLAAGRTPGSGSLAALGPNMALARDLLDRGESPTVVLYLEECGQFWDGNRGKLAEWIALVKAGLKPDFGRNLDY